MNMICRDLELHIPQPISLHPPPPLLQRPNSASTAPQVTISNAGGSVVEYLPPPCSSSSSIFRFDVSPASMHEVRLSRPCQHFQCCKGM